MKDYYTIMGVSQHASQAQIRKAYLHLALDYHPDKHLAASPADRAGFTEKFQQLNHINEVLSDVTKRELYNEALRQRGADFAHQVFTDPLIEAEFKSSLNRGTAHGGAGFFHATSRPAPPPSARPAPPPSARPAPPPSARPATPPRARAATPPSTRAATPPRARPATPPFKLPVIIGVRCLSTLIKGLDGYKSLNVLLLSNDTENSFKLLKAMSTYANSTSTINPTNLYNTIKHPDSTQKISCNFYSPTDIKKPDPMLLSCIDVFMIIGDDLESTRKAMHIANGATFYMVDPDSAKLTYLYLPYSPDRDRDIQSLFGSPGKKLANETGEFLFNLLTEALSFIKEEPTLKSTPPDPESGSGSSCIIM